MTFRRLSTPLRCAAGFSMVEFLLVAVILGVGLLGLAALTTMSVRGFGGGRTREAASNLASGVLDQLSLDGRLSGAIRLKGGSIPGTAKVANAADGAVNPYVDPATGTATFDLQGQPSTSAPVFTITWVRMAPNATTPAVAATSLVDASQVVVNVQWNQVVKNAAGASITQPRYISVGRIVRY